MSYQLNQLYDAIAASGKVIGRFTVNSEREYGSGAVNFLSKTGKIQQVYASPHWEIENFEVEIVGPTESQIAYQFEAYDENGDYLGNCGADSWDFQLTGDLEADLSRYFEVVDAKISTLE